MSTNNKYNTLVLYYIESFYQTVFHKTFWYNLSIQVRDRRNGKYKLLLYNKCYIETFNQQHLYFWSCFITWW